MAARRGGINDALKASLAQQEQDVAVEVTSTIETPVARPRATVTVHEIPHDAIAPNLANPRKDMGDLEALAGTIADQGILQPLTVRPLTADERDTYPDGTRYVLLMGERRWTAAKIAGLATVPAMVRSDLNDTERQVMIVENLQRAELSPVEEARAFAELIELTGASQRALAAQLHLTQPHISRRLALLDLAPGLLALVEAGAIGVDVATNELAKLPETQQAYVLDRLTIDDTSPLDITPDVVRRHIAQATIEAQKLARLDAQRTWATTHDVTLFDDYAALREHAQRHDMTTTLAGKPSSMSAKQARAHVAVLAALDNEPDLYRLDTRPAPQPTPAPADDSDDTTPTQGRPEDDAPEPQQGDTAGITPHQDTDTDLFGNPVPAPAVSWPIADDPTDRRRKIVDKAVAEWVKANPKPPAKSALAQRLAEYMVLTAGADITRVVMGWVGDHIGEPGLTSRDWPTWKYSVEPKDAITVAWLITVAAELAAARQQAPGRPAFEATRERVVQVLDDAALQELGLSRQEQN